MHYLTPLAFSFAWLSTTHAWAQSPTPEPPQPETPDQSAVTFQLGYTAIWQVSDGAQTLTPQNSILTGSFDLSGQWHIIPQDAGFGTASIGWLLEGGQHWTANHDDDLGSNLGVTLGLNDDFDEQDIALSELWWQHQLGPIIIQDPEQDVHRFTFSVGKLDQTAFFDQNRVANDPATQFLATPLVNNSAVAFPDNGLGFNTRVQFNDQLYLTAGFGDANADARETGFNTFDASELFWAAEIGVAYTLPQLGEGQARLLIWATDTGDAQGNGIAISADQRLTDHLIAFFRAGIAEDDVVDFERFFSAGLGIEQPFGREDDLFAFGVATAKPADGSREETFAEVFYRHQATPWLAVTPLVQVVWDPAGNPTEDAVFVAGFRLQADW